MLPTAVTHGLDAGHVGSNFLRFKSLLSCAMSPDAANVEFQGQAGHLFPDTWCAIEDV